MRTLIAGGRDRHGHFRPLQLQLEGQFRPLVHGGRQLLARRALRLVHPGNCLGSQSRKIQHLRVGR